MKRVCVFCGSSLGGRDVYREAAASLGAALARRGLELIYGGARVG
jgi:predicted Rossmann-fold nucleotide-binding protein